MPFIMGHMTGGWGLGRITQWITKRRFTHLEWGLLIFGALLPDFDHVLDWTIDTQVHRTFTHSLVFLFVAFVGMYLVSKAGRSLNKEMDAKRNAIMLTFGVMTHLVLDLALGYPGIALFWPHLSSVYLFGIAPYNPEGLLAATVSNPAKILKIIIIDMAVGGAWIGYFFITKRIRF